MILWIFIHILSSLLYLILYLYHPFVVQVFFFYVILFLVSTFARAQLWKTVAKTKGLKMVYSSHVSPASHGKRAADIDAQGNSWGKEFLSIDFQWEINEKDNETRGLIRSSSAYITFGKRKFHVGTFCGMRGDQVSNTDCGSPGRSPAWCSWLLKARLVSGASAQSRHVVPLTARVCLLS